MQEKEGSKRGREKGEKRGRKMNEGTKRMEDVDVVIVAEKGSVQKTGGKIRERIKGKERGEVGTQTMYDEKKAGRGKKNGKGGWMKVIRGTRSAE